MLPTMIARAVLAWLLALPVFVIVAARDADENRDYTFTIRMATDVSGTLQLFTDTGTGFSERQSYPAPLIPDGEPHDYPLQIPPGRYRVFRIDPGTLPGRTTVFHVEIRDADGALIARAPLIGVQPMTRLTTVARDDERVTFETAAGDFDPQFGWTPAAPLPLYRAGVPRSRAIGALLMAWAGAMALVMGAASSGRRVRDTLVRAAARAGAASSRRPRLAIAGAAVAGVLVSAYPVLVAGRSLFSPHNGGNRMLYHQLPFTPGSTDARVEDTRGSDVATATWMFLPFTRIQREALASGEFPLWNRYNAGGRPLWGQGYGFLFDPLHWVALAVPDLSWALDLKFVAHRLVFALGIGLVAFEVTRRVLPAAIVAASAPFLGVYTFRFNHPQPFVLTYIPVVLLGWLALASGDGRARRRGVFLLAAGTVLVLYSALPKEAVISLTAACATGAAIVLLSARDWRTRASSLAWAGAAGAAALLTTAPHWLIFADTLRQSETAYDAPFAVFGGLPHALALALGPVTPAEVLPGFHALALAAVAAALCVPGALAARRAGLASAVASAALLAIAFGAIPERAIVSIPLLARVHHVEDVFVVAAAPMLLVVCACGLAALSSAGRRRRLIVTAVTGAASAALLLLTGRLSAPGAFELPAAFAVLSAATVLPIVWDAGGREAPSPSRAAACAAALLFVAAPGGLHLETRLRALDRVLFQPRPRVDYAAPAPVVDEIRRGLQPARAAGVEWVLFPGSQGVYALEGLSGGGDALQLPRYERLADAAGLTRGWFYFLFLRPEALPRAAGFLDLMNVRYLLMDPRITVRDGGAPRVPPGDRLALSVREGAWPRAFFADGVTRYGSLDAFAGTLARGAGPVAAVQSGDEPAGVPTVAWPSRVVPADRYTLTPNSTAFHVHAPSAGVAVLTETYLPDDFIVTLNGARAPYFRVNHAFKGMVIPAAGDWDIRVEYRPARWRLSLALAAAGVVLLLALGIRAAR